MWNSELSTKASDEDKELEAIESDMDVEEKL